MIEPYPYQQKIIDSAIEHLRVDDTHLIQLFTSGGKTAIFSFFIKWFLSWSPKNVLILAHREELIGQAEAELSGIGIGSEPYYGKKALKHHSRVYLSMIETASRRLQKNPYFFPNVGLVITDESHVLIFQKVFQYFQRAKILGCTATPITTKRETFYKCKMCRASYEVPQECCGSEVDEWTRPYSLNRIYKNITVGPPPSELIEFGSIVQEISFKRHYTDDSQLKTDADGEYTIESVEKEYGTTNAVFNVLLNYEELCKGKKTLIFNSSTKTNLSVYNKFIEAGYTNVRMYDSVNTIESGSRHELLEWFANTPDAILINSRVFTTGFNSREVEAIIVNCPIGVLSLWLQICGRGCRSSLKIFKPNYILVDGGGNIDRFGEPSTTRDWYSIFHGKGAERAKSINAEDVHSCPECNALYAKQALTCPYCGFEIKPKPPTPEREGTYVLQPIRPIPPPNGKLIYEYTLRMGEDINFAFKIMVNQIVDMFKFYRVTPLQYQESLTTGELDKKTMEQIRKCYFVLLSKPDIQSKGKRTLSELLNRTKKQLKKYYENR
jgi:superfamily II DNA or RNA helicase